MRIYEIITEAPITNDPERKPWGLVPYNGDRGEFTKNIQKVLTAIGER